MENEGYLKVEEVLSSSASLFERSLSMDCSKQSENILEEIKETCDSCVNTCNDLKKKEFEYNQFFILAETSSPTEKSSLNCLEQSDNSEVVSAVAHNDKCSRSDQVFVEAENCEVFHGILESEGVVIEHTRRALQHCSILNNDCDVSRETNDEADHVDGVDQKLINEVDAINKVTSTNATRSVAQCFLKDMKQNNETRCKILEEVSSSSSADIKADTKDLKAELELVEKFDLKIQELESVEPSTCSSRYWLSSEGRKGIPSAVLYLRDEKKRWKRRLVLKRALQKLDAVQSQSSNKHILRNVLLGPRARYFSLTLHCLYKSSRVCAVKTAMEQ